MWRMPNRVRPLLQFLLCCMERWCIRNDGLLGEENREGSQGNIAQASFELTIVYVHRIHFL